MLTGAKCFFSAKVKIFVTQTQQVMLSSRLVWRAALSKNRTRKVSYELYTGHHAGWVSVQKKTPGSRCHTPGCFGTLSARVRSVDRHLPGLEQVEEDPCRFSLRVIAVHLPSRLTLGDREIKQTHGRRRWDKTTRYVYCSTPTVKDVNAKRCLLAHTKSLATPSSDSHVWPRCQWISRVV